MDNDLIILVQALWLVEAFISLAQSGATPSLQFSWKTYVEHLRHFKLMLWVKTSEEWVQTMKFGSWLLFCGNCDSKFASIHVSQHMNIGHFWCMHLFQSQCQIALGPFLNICPRITKIQRQWHSRQGQQFFDNPICPFFSQYFHWFFIVSRSQECCVPWL